MAKYEEAKAMYKTLCQTLNNIEWRYNGEEKDDQFVVETAAVGSDLKMGLHILIEVDRQLMYLKSPMPFRAPEDKMDLLGKAVLIANYSMLNGSFEMDLSDGYIAFKIVVPFMSSMISTEVCRYMIIVSCNMVDCFNDKFQALCDGKMTLQEFQDFVENSDR